MDSMFRARKVKRESHGIGGPPWFGVQRRLSAGARVGIVVIVLIAVAAGGNYFHHSRPTGPTRVASTTATAPHIRPDITATTPPPATTRAGSTQLATNGAASTAKGSPATTQTPPPNTVTPTYHCDTAAQAVATNQHRRDLATENEYHLTQLTLLPVNYTLDEIFHPATYNTLVDQENSRHALKIQQIDQALATALQAAHC